MPERSFPPFPFPSPSFLPPSRFGRELETLLPALLEAGRILERGAGSISGIRHKADNSLVTDIDARCAEFLDHFLHGHFPGDAVLNEETGGHGGRHASWRKAERCWYVDPLDSTSSYVRGAPHYGVLLGLAEEGLPVFGLTFRPAGGEIFFAAKGEGAYRFRLHRGEAAAGEGGDPAWFLQPGDQPQRIAVSSEDKVRLVVSHGRPSEQMDAWVKRLGNPPLQKQNGSLKICEVARGGYTAFLSPPRNRMSLWDLCAPGLILAEAGGRMTDLEGRDIDFTAEDVVHHGGLLASNGRVHEAILKAI